jgi:hypothetical protein
MILILLVTIRTELPGFFCFISLRHSFTLTCIVAERNVVLHWMMMSVFLMIIWRRELRHETSHLFLTELGHSFK